MALIQHEKIYVDRGYDDWIYLSELLDRLGWIHYPENVTGEEIDEGDDSDAACEEHIEVPYPDIPLFELLERQGTFNI